MADLQARADRYGLPPLRFPEGWPLDGLTAMRAATWAGSDAFVHEAFRRQFVSGIDISTREQLTDIAAHVGLGEPAFDDPEVKAKLRAATDAAWAAGVRGIPSLQVGDEIFFGADQLEAAIRCAARAVAVRASVISVTMISAAGAACASSCAWPAHRLKPSASPAARARARSGAVRWWTSG